MSRIVKFAKNGIIINAQEYRKWREWLTPGRWVSEHLFTDYASVLERLRQADDAARAIALGEKSVYNISVKNAIAEAKTALKENRLIDAVYYAAIVNAIAEEVLVTTSPTLEALRTKLYEQYTGGSNPKSMEMMQGLQERMQVRNQTAQAIANNQFEIKRYAQFLQNIYRTFMGGDPLQRSWRAEVEKFKAPVANLVAQAEQFGTMLLSSFDRMGIARASGKLGDWVNEFDNLKNVQPSYEKAVLSAFTALQPIIEVAKNNQQVKQEMGNKADADMISQVLTSTHAPTGESAESTQHGASVQPDEAHTGESLEETPVVNQPVDSSIPAGEETAGQPVISGLDQPANEPVSEKKPERRGPGRPRKTVTETMGIDPKVLANHLKNQGKSDEEIKQYLRELGLPEIELKETGIQPVEPMNLQQLMNQLDEVDEADLPDVAMVLSNVVNNDVSENESIQDGEGNIIATVENGIVVFEDVELDVPVDMAPKVLGYMQMAGMLPEYEEAQRLKGIPMGPNVMGPSGKPVITPPPSSEESSETSNVKSEETSFEEPKIEEPKTPVLEQTPKLTEVESGEVPQAGSDMAVIFTDAPFDTQKQLKKLKSVLGKNVSVVSLNSREKAKSSYPEADYYVFKATPEGNETQIPDSIINVLSGRMTKKKKQDLYDMMGIKSPMSSTPKSKAEVIPEPTVEPMEEEEVKVLEPGVAVADDVTAKVNKDIISNFLKPIHGVDPKQADVIIIGTERLTAPERDAAEAALKSFFNKDVHIVLDRDHAYELIEREEGYKKAVSVLGWDRSSIRSVIQFVKGQPSAQPQVTASVEEAMLKRSHRSFFNQLKQAQQLNDPFLMAQMMIRYSEVMENRDPNLSIQLLVQAQELLDV